ncbi:hypothetical protein POM88_025653 [Heracleum sosnowskyi]|uniref:DRBM domain-containing protein n=1 Tax=Heracleum sosnowskyi TaxID=360622 RepID=A0AAD8I4B6_9APIA|nr:hypothetical protein POM88_025653 [Heracleum sosnowskyi]
MDTLIWKSILNEYSMKMKAEKPIYNSETANGQPPAFVTSLTFNGRRYVGAKGRSKKESRPLAARDVILSILDSDARTVISKIIINLRHSSAKEIVKYPCNAQNVVMRVGIQTKSNAGTSASDGNKLDDNMPRAAISEPIENSTSVSAISVPLHEFRLPKEEASVVQSNGTPVIYAPSNMEQLAIKSISAEKGKHNFTVLCLRMS